MKICYIAHPISGDVEDNLTDIRRIVRKINIYGGPDIVPFVPYYVDTVAMNDRVPDERARGIKNGAAVLTSGVVDELWLTGKEISPGMAAEAKLAREKGIPVIDLTGLL